MDKNNNPAGRLHSLLLEGKKQSTNVQASVVWAKLLNVPEDDKSLLLRRVGHVLTLPSNIKEAMSHIEDLNHEVYLKWLPRVETSFSVLNFQIQWKQFIDRFDAEIMYGIEICADRLSREQPEKTADSEKLDKLLDKVNELLEELESSEMDNNLWFYIYDNLQRVKEAIEEYSICGIKPLEAAFERAVGNTVLTPNIYKECQNTDIGKSFWEFMSRLAIVITIAQGAIQIGNGSVFLIPDATINSNDQEEVVEVPGEAIIEEKPKK